ncbi:hypothetical protein PCIT_a2595 [Pseudoalteromonas citrea]|uniref:WD40-like Beta Propeller Repeat n=2 Tax=Pseudoalteromonas citrea TaxID=43655 RepID=A0AAD4FRE3_9GAMM|nr:PD40 domain-containing protein [Pseudoalteromonas citrea]KAF7769706.1 hypothetical protein PCIT_a2595 [Pseudoalteromonas citrea]
MKVILTPALLLLSACVVTDDNNNQDNIPVLEGPYLGQEPPSLIPQIFAPGYVSTRHRDFSGSFTPDMKEFYFSRLNVDTEKWWLIRFKLENNQWKESVVGPRVGRPTLAPDGNTMHLGSQYMTRTSSGWSTVKSLGKLFDRDDWGIMRLSSSIQGTYIFDDYKNHDVLRISEMKNGQRQPPKLLPSHINSGKWTAHPFIAADGSYLIWDSEKADGFGDKDLYISFRHNDGSWGNAVNLGKTINTDAMEASAYVSPDGKYLFFNRSPLTAKEGEGSEGDIYWVSAQIIDTLKAKSLTPG